MLPHSIPDKCIFPDSLQGLEFLDVFHDYPDIYGNIRYYHRLKAALCRKFINAQADMSKVFLDAGAGRGPYTFLACNLYRTLYCYEYDSKELAYAQKNLQESSAHIEFAQVDLTRIPLPNGIVDSAVCSEVLEHIEDYNAAAQELFRVLKTGGRLLLSMPNAYSLFYLRVRLKNWALRHKPDLSHDEWELLRHFSFSFFDIERIAVSAGFAIRCRMSANILPLSNSLRTRLMQKNPRLFKMYSALDIVLSRLFPWFGSFYFLELEK